jgi:hypothetical protein
MSVFLLCVWFVVFVSSSSLSSVVSFVVVRIGKQGRGEGKYRRVSVLYGEL